MALHYKQDLPTEVWRDILLVAFCALEVQLASVGTLQMSGAVLRFSSSSTEFASPRSL